MNEMTVPLIPRVQLFGNPKRVGNAISPDGQWITYHAPVDGVMNLWIAPRENPLDGTPLTRDSDRGVGGHMWTFDSKSILYTQDDNGNEYDQIFLIDIASRSIRGLAQNPEVMFYIAGMSIRYPGSVLVGSNERDPRWHDLYLYDIATGARRLVEENDGFGSFIVDEELEPKVASRYLPDGSCEVCRKNGRAWEPWIRIGAEDAQTTGPIMLSEDGKTLYFADSRGREATALLAMDMETGAERVVAEDPRGPVGIALTDNDTYEPLAWGITLERSEVHLLDDRARKDVERFQGMQWGEWSVTSRSLDDRFWTVGVSSDLNPGAAYLYDRQADTLEKIADGRPELADAPLARMRHFTIPSRDGLPLVCYLTIPVDFDETQADGLPRSREPVAMVVDVHGGPTMRDTFGFRSGHQWLANRGYAVLSVNFRGSSGFSKSFQAAGDGEWGGKMSDDLDDAVAWVVERGVADPKRVAISGASFGGYAVLVAMTRSPEAYACGIDLVGPSNLKTLMEEIPAHWEAGRASLYRKVGDPNTQEGLALMHERSPLHRAGDIRRPLLIGQGAHDPRVLKQEADQMVNAMQASGVPVTYLLYPDEGHGFGRPANAVSFNAISEAFLAEQLGGRVEPLHPDEIRGNSLQVVTGGEWLEKVLPKEVRFDGTATA